MRAYQTSGIERIVEILRRRKSAFLADEMGLGKSAQAVKAAERLQVQKLLIVCPASLRLNWQRELHKFGTGWHINIVRGRRDLKNVTWSIAAPTATICSYEMADFMPPHLCGCVDMIIYDEVHYLKTPTTKRTKACLQKLWYMTEYNLCLSGTPCPNGIMDGFTIFNKLDPSTFKDRYSYGFRYTNATRNWWTGGWDFKGGRNLNELRRKVQKFMLRRKKENVLTELPPKVYSTVPLEVKGTKDYQLSEEHKQIVREGKSASVASAYATARRGLGILKIPEVADYIQEVAKHKERLVIFAYHTQVIQTLSEMLEAKGLRVRTITGATPMPQRDKIVQEFQSPDKVRRVLVAQMQAAGIGINLTAADTCIFAEPDWVPATMAQAIDRLHRIGQAESVAIHYLVAAGTMDEDIVAALTSKIKVISEAIDGRQYHAC